MEFNEYQNLANRTLQGKEQVLTNCALGLAAETGEVIDRVKRYTFQNHDFDREMLVKEMGDVLWYLSQIAQWADIEFDEVAQDNITRLKKRYPKSKKL